MEIQRHQQQLQQTEADAEATLELHVERGRSEIESTRSRHAAELEMKERSHELRLGSAQAEHEVAAQTALDDLEQTMRQQHDEERGALEGEAADAVVALGHARETHAQAVENLAQAHRDNLVEILQTTLGVGQEEGELGVGDEERGAHRRGILKGSSGVAAGSPLYRQTRSGLRRRPPAASPSSSTRARVSIGGTIDVGLDDLAESGETFRAAPTTKNRQRSERRSGEGRGGGGSGDSGDGWERLKKWADGSKDASATIAGNVEVVNSLSKLRRISRLAESGGGGGLAALVSTVQAVRRQIVDAKNTMIAEAHEAHDRALQDAKAWAAAEQEAAIARVEQERVEAVEEIEAMQRAADADAKEKARALNARHTVMLRTKSKSKQSAEARRTMEAKHAADLRAVLAEQARLTHDAADRLLKIRESHNEDLARVRVEKSAERDAVLRRVEREQRDAVDTALNASEMETAAKVRALETLYDDVVRDHSEKASAESAEAAEEWERERRTMEGKYEREMVAVRDEHEALHVEAAAARADGVAYLYSGAAGNVGTAWEDGDWSRREKRAHASPGSRGMVAPEAEDVLDKLRRMPHGYDKDGLKNGGVADIAGTMRAVKRQMADVKRIAVTEAKRAAEERDDHVHILEAQLAEANTAQGELEVALSWRHSQLAEAQTALEANDEAHAKEIAELKQGDEDERRRQEEVVASLRMQRRKSGVRHVDTEELQKKHIVQLAESVEQAHSASASALLELQSEWEQERQSHLEKEELLKQSKAELEESTRQRIKKTVLRCWRAAQRENLSASWSKWGRAVHAINHRNHCVGVLARRGARRVQRGALAAWRLHEQGECTMQMQHNWAEEKKHSVLRQEQLSGLVQAGRIHHGGARLMATLRRKNARRTDTAWQAIRLHSIHRHRTTSAVRRIARRTRMRLMRTYTRQWREGCHVHAIEDEQLFARVSMQTHQLSRLLRSRRAGVLRQAYTLLVDAVAIHQRRVRSLLRLGRRLRQSKRSRWWQRWRHIHRVHKWEMSFVESDLLEHMDHVDTAIEQVKSDAAAGVIENVIKRQLQEEYVILNALRRVVRAFRSRVKQSAWRLWCRSTLIVKRRIRALARVYAHLRLRSLQSSFSTFCRHCAGQEIDKIATHLENAHATNAMLSERRRASQEQRDEAEKWMRHEVQVLEKRLADAGRDHSEALQRSADRNDLVIRDASEAAQTKEAALASSVEGLRRTVQRLKSNLALGKQARGLVSCAHVLERCAVKTLARGWLQWKRWCSASSRRGRVLRRVIDRGLLRVRRRLFRRWHRYMQGHVGAERQQQCEELASIAQAANKNTSASIMRHTLAVVASRSVHTAWVAWMRFVSFHRRREVVVGKLGRRFHHVGLRDAFRTLCRATAAVASEEADTHIALLKERHSNVSAQMSDHQEQHAKAEAWFRDEARGMEQRHANVSRGHEEAMVQLRHDAQKQLEQTTATNQIRENAVVSAVETSRAQIRRMAVEAQQRSLERLARTIYARHYGRAWRRWLYWQRNHRSFVERRSALVRLQKRLHAGQMQRCWFRLRLATMQHQCERSLAGVLVVSQNQQSAKLARERMARGYAIRSLWRSTALRVERTAWNIWRGYVIC